MKKRILHIQVLPLMSGVQKISLEIMRNLDEKEYEKYILFSDTDTGEKKAVCTRLFTEAGVNVIFSEKLKRSIGLWDFKALIEIYRLCKKQKFDIVHTNSTKPGIVGRIAATMAGVPVVVHTVHGIAFHDFEKFPKRQFYCMCEMIASFFCDSIVTVNKYYLKYFKLFKKKMSVIYNGLDFSLFPEKQVSTDDNVRVLFVGRLEFQKDPLTVLKTAKLVLEKCPDAVFTIVGDGTLYEPCRKFIEENHLDDKIILVKWQKNVADFYSSHDIFLTASLYESFGLTFLEAGFYELSVVTTNVEGIPEVVIDGETGFLSNPADAAALAGNVVRLIEDKNLRESMGRSGKKRVTELFTEEKMVGKYKDLYESLYEKKVPQR